MVGVIWNWELIHVKDNHKKSPEYLLYAVSFLYWRQSDEKDKVSMLIDKTVSTGHFGSLLKGT